VSARFGLQAAQLRGQTWWARLGAILRVESLAKPSPGQDLSRHGQKRSAARTSGRPTCVRKRSKSMLALWSTMTSSMVDDDANIVLDLQMPDRLGRSSSHILPSGPRMTCSDIMTGPTAHRSTVPRSQVGHLPHPNTSRFLILAFEMAHDRLTLFLGPFRFPQPHPRT